MFSKYGIAANSGVGISAILIDHSRQLGTRLEVRCSRFGIEKVYWRCQIELLHQPSTKSTDVRGLKRKAPG